jgi:hypothetical protein
VNIRAEDPGFPEQTVQNLNQKIAPGSCYDLRRG